MPVWTESQQKAICAVNSEILVSAAAGSGKTAVLVERVVFLLEKGFDLKRMIIVTFTKNAAAEMRQRLHARLKELSREKSLFRAALQDLEQTQITTIHGFCEKLIRKEFQHLDIDPLFSIVEGSERQLIFDEAARNALNELLEENEHTAALAEAVGQTTLLEWNEKLHTFLMSLPEPFVWLRRQIDDMTRIPLSDQLWFKSRENMIALQVQDLEELIAFEASLFDQPDAYEKKQAVMQDDQLFIQAVRHCLTLPVEERADAIESAKPGSNASAKIPEASREWNERFKDIHTQIVKTAIALKDDYLNVSTAEWQHEISTEQQYLTGLADLTERTEKLFHEAKQKRDLIDFHDMEQMTLAMLQDPERAEEIRGRFDHLFIDECQDVSAVQDAIIQKLHRPEGTLFMVGDVKQSIYRFRRAEPGLFMQRIRSFSDDPDAVQRRIFLQNNFRSVEPILDTTNTVFRQIMRRDITEMDYLPEDELIAGKEEREGKPVQIIAVPMEKGAKSKDKLIDQVEAVISSIQKLVLPVEEGGEGYLYRDIAILMPKLVNRGVHVAKQLEAAGIPSFCDDTESYFDFPEVRALIEVLKLLDNQLQDIPLLTAMQLEPFRFNEHDITAVSLCCTEKNRSFYDALMRCAEGSDALAERCSAFLKKIEAWRFDAAFTPMPEMIWKIIEETGLLSRAGALPNGVQRQANLRLVCEEADAFEQQQKGELHAFLQAIEDSRKSGDQLNARVLSDQDNVVRIMTVHKSKGLQYPVVILLGLGESIGVSKRSELCLHPQLGLAIPYYNQKLLIKRNTARQQAFLDQIRLDEKAERVRLLYVAMTRAQKRMLLIVPGDEGTWTRPTAKTNIFSLSSMSDWLRMALLRPGIQCDSWRLETPKEAIPPEEQHRTLDELWKSVQQPAVKKLIGMEEARQSDRASKTSVSSLIRMRNEADSLPDDVSDTDETVADKAKPYGAMLLSELPARPGWLQEEQRTGAEFGTLMHRLMASLDLEAIRKAYRLTDCLKAELERMRLEHFFTDDEAAHVRLREAEGFLSSTLGRRMLGAEKIRREWHFNVKWDGEEANLLQGVIDLAFFSDGAWTVIDYKTDRIEDDDAFVEQYRFQLQLYAGAVEAITGQKVAELWLYSLKKSRAYPVSMDCST